MSTINKIQISGVTYDLGGSGGAGLDENTEKVISSAFNDLDSRKADRILLKNYQLKGDYVDEKFVKDELSAYKTIEEDDKDSKVISAALNHLNENAGGTQYEPKTYHLKITEIGNVLGFELYETLDRPGVFSNKVQNPKDVLNEGDLVMFYNIENLIYIAEVNKIDDIIALQVIYSDIKDYYDVNYQVLNVSTFFFPSYTDQYLSYCSSVLDSNKRPLSSGGYLLNKQDAINARNAATFKESYNFISDGPIRSKVFYSGIPAVRKIKGLNFSNSIIGSEVQKRSGYDVVPLVRVTVEKDGIIGKLRIDKEYNIYYKKEGFYSYNQYQLYSDPIEITILDEYLPGWGAFKIITSYNSTTVNTYTSLNNCFGGFGDEDGLVRFHSRYDIDGTYMYLDFSSFTGNYLMFNITPIWDESEDTGIIYTESFDNFTTFDDGVSYGKYLSVLKGDYDRPYSDSISNYSPYSYYTFENFINDNILIFNGNDISGLLSEKQDKMTGNYLSKVDVGGSSISIETKAFADESVQKTDNINFKTINGQAIFGMGDIKIEGGGGSVDAYTKAESDDKFALKDDVPTLQTSSRGNNKNYIYSDGVYKSINGVVSYVSASKSDSEINLDFRYWGENAYYPFLSLQTASPSQIGLMSKDDKIKLDSIDTENLVTKEEFNNTVGNIEELLSKI